MMDQILILQKVSIKSAMKQLNKAGEKCLVVIDKNKKFLGTLSDGDIRKSLLKGFTLSDSIEKIYNRNSTSVEKGDFIEDEIKRIFLDSKFDLIPVINKNGTVDSCLTWEKIFDTKKDNNTLKKIDTVIMAGGKGTRLAPFTDVLPKPLIPIHDRPIIQHIIEKFATSGIINFYISINYKGKILKAFFEELDSKSNFNFLEEEHPLGTAGSLQLLNVNISNPFFVTNCDTIIDIDFNDLYDFHIKNENIMTLVASAKEYIIPYGTCKIDKDGSLLKIAEKPQLDFLINTGLYVLSPEVLKLIPKDKFYDITDLIEAILKKGKRVGVFPINDDAWIDIGQWSEYKQAIEKLN